MEEIKREVSDLVAFLLSDASMHLHKLPDGRKRDRISIDAVDIDLVKSMQSVLQTLTQKQIRITERIRDEKWSKVHHLELIVPKDLKETLTKLSSTFRTKPFEDGVFPKSEIPKEIIKSTLEMKQSFLRIFASAEGSIILAIHKQRKWWAIGRRVSIKCVHPKIREQLKEMFESLEIKVSVIGDDIRIMGKERLIKFRDLVGFISGCKVTKKSHSKWEGTEKSKLLELAIKLFDIDKRKIQQMTKGEIFLWLKSQIPT